MDALNKKFGVPDDYVFIIDIRSVNNTIINESVQDMRRALIENASVVCDRSTDSARMMISNISRTIRSNFFFYLSKGIRVFLDVEVPVCLFNYKKRLMDEIKRISEETNVLVFLQIGNDESRNEECSGTATGQAGITEELYGSLESLKFETDDVKPYGDEAPYIYEKNCEKTNIKRFSESPNCYCFRAYDTEAYEKDACECERYGRNDPRSESFPNYDYNEDLLCSSPLSNNESLFSDSSGHVEDDHGDNMHRYKRGTYDQRSASMEKGAVTNSTDCEKSAGNNLESNITDTGIEPGCSDVHSRNTEPEREQGTKDSGADVCPTNSSSGASSLQAESEITIQINGRWKESAIARLKILKFIENCFGNDLKFINCERTYFNLENKRRYYYGTKINYKLAITQNTCDKEIISRRNFDDVYFFEIDTVKLFYLFYYHKKQIEDVLCSYHSFFETSKINNTSTTVKLTGKNHKIVQKAIMGMTEDIFKVLVSEVPYPIPDTFIFKTHERSMIVGKKPNIIELLKYRDVYCHVQIELSKELEEFLCGKKNGKINRIIKDTGTKISITVNNVMTIYISGQSANVSVAIHAVENEFPEELAFHLSERHHKRIIGFGGKNIQRIMKKHGVYIKFMSEYERRQNNYSGNVVVKTPRKNREALEKMKSEILMLADEKEYKREIVQIRITVFEFFLFFIVRAVGYRMLFDEVILSFSRGTDTFLFKDYFLEVDKTPFENLLLESEKVREEEISCDAETNATDEKESDTEIKERELLVGHDEERKCDAGDGKENGAGEALNGDGDLPEDEFGGLGHGPRDGYVRNCAWSSDNGSWRPSGGTCYGNKAIANEYRGVLGDQHYENSQERNVKNATPTDTSNIMWCTPSQAGVTGKPESERGHRAGKSIIEDSNELESKDQSVIQVNRPAITGSNPSGKLIDIMDWAVQKQKAELNMAYHGHSDTTVNNKGKDASDLSGNSLRPHTACMKKIKLTNTEINAAGGTPSKMDGNNTAFDGAFDRKKVVWDEEERRYHTNGSVPVNGSPGCGRQLPISEKATSYVANDAFSAETADQDAAVKLNNVQKDGTDGKENEKRSPFNADEELSSTSGSSNKPANSAEMKGKTAKHASSAKNDLGSGEEHRYYDLNADCSNKTAAVIPESSIINATGSFIDENLQRMQYVNDETMKIVSHINSIMSTTGNISTISLSGICTESMIRDINDVVGLSNAKKEFYFDILGKREKLIKKISPFYYQIGKNYKCTFAFAHAITLKDGSFFLRSFQQIEQHQDGVSTLIHINALKWCEERKLAFKIFHSQLFYSYENSLNESKIGDEAGSSDNGPKIGSLLTVGFEKGKKQSSMR
ncbi:hypothetical protein VCUG_01031 [Vavraia culicis subsp. floridensis]|uniref:K Homology domain-containing protein n=1 Tax=Vavraia culicis (isolate floridensis) TaxID=948595 RepID=L2GV52_VAVCU|nr:uncharacterized protein VCUG_01031 [Vavraia culicis subsp. floridensis]ELA47499.1 hypothetical protein VCUG_01031 [Vavraia culicis subsp. floridensis]